MAIVAPEGIEFSLSLYATTEEAGGVDTVMVLSGMSSLPDSINAEGFLANLPAFIPGWRVMTRSEIKAYKAKQEEEERDRRAYEDDDHAP